MGLQPIVLYLAPFGPNPWKVAIILTELKIPYTSIPIWDMTDLKKPPFTDVNPNGRAPAIKDPNTGIVLWESNAIIAYLIDEYDKSHTLTYTTSPEKHLLRQWAFFQASGQGPYYGQGAWFNIFHPEKLPSAQKRYTDEIHRLIGVLESALSKKSNTNGTDGPWLVGDKCTYVDLAFFMWDENVEMITAGAPASAGDKSESESKSEGAKKQEDGAKGGFDKDAYPAWRDWHRRMADREAVKKVLEEKKVLLEQGAGKH